MKTKVINLYGGPSSGKSTQASGLFYKMKQQGYNVELVNEFAKECVWENNVPMLKDQLWVLAHQHRKLVRLSGKVDYIITDSPVLLSVAYRTVYDGPMYTESIDVLAKECYEMYDNLNIYLNRTTEFTEEGRAQDLEHSIHIDKHIIKILDDMQVPYFRIDVDNETVPKVLRLL